MLIYDWPTMRMGEQTAIPFNFIWLLEDLTFPMPTYFPAYFSFWSFTPDGSDDSHYRRTRHASRPLLVGWYWISTRFDCYLITKLVQPHHHHYLSSSAEQSCCDCSHEGVFTQSDNTSLHDWRHYNHVKTVLSFLLNQITACTWPRFSSETTPLKVASSLGVL